MITISIADQTLEYQGKIYSISSAKNGVGEVEGSYCTPTGQFKISEKIGDNLEVGSVLVARAPTGEIYSPALLAKHPDRDWILTRILWLEGAEAHNQNTKDRYIYIHGSPDEVSMGVPGSKGCIRIRNSDVIELFEKVQIGEDVVIMKP
ncbi:MAG: L,D-transpeptidase [Candidatus Thioglobus sp.]|nr:MAG: L,D-transpeptidase [Candidatus Thioglobus sp.]